MPVIVRLAIFQQSVTSRPSLRSSERRGSEHTMPLLNGLRIVMIVQVLTLLLQATFAGMMIGGNHQAANLHEFTAKILVPLALVQTVLAIVLRVQARCHLWVPVASAALFA